MTTYNIVTEHIAQIIVSFVIGVAGIAVGFFKGRKKRIAGVKTEEGDALKGIQESYDILVAHVNTKIKDISVELSEVKSENIKQREELRKLQSDNRKMHNKISELIKENANWKIENNRLQQLLRDK